MESCTKCNNDKEKCDNIIDVWKIWTNISPIPVICNGTSLNLLGWSRAAMRTNFIIKQLGLSFDGGLSCPYEMKHLFLTHGHLDHSASVTFYTLTSKNIVIYAPNEISEILREKIEKDFELTEGYKKCDANNSYSIRGVVDGEIIPINLKKIKLNAEIIKCYHSVPCVSYGLFYQDKKLKNEYKGIEKDEISKLVKSGVNINISFNNYFFLYIGDTSSEILMDNRIYKYSVIMIECTFIFDRDIQHAIDTNHIHWSQLEPIIRLYPDIKFILYHFSLRQSSDELYRFFDDIGLDNVYPWISS